MAKPTEPPKQEFVISAGMVKWIISVAGGLVVLIGGWFVVWDRIDTHWRQESIAAAKDKEYAAEMKRIDADVKAARDKAENDTKLLAKKAETGRAWVLYSVMDSKADISTKFVKVCKGLKLPAEDCISWAEDARQARDEATRKKTAAEETGKDK